MKLPSNSVSANSSDNEIMIFISSDAATFIMMQDYYANDYRVSLEDANSFNGSSRSSWSLGDDTDR